MTSPMAESHPPCPPLPPPVTRILSSLAESRLRAAVALIAHTRLPVMEILDLRWSQVDLTTGAMLMASGVTHLTEPQADLLYWHAARQRMDRRQVSSWPGADRVIVDQRGAPYSWVRADNEVALACRSARMPIVNLNSLRHPVFR